jgi:hypothetical protein
MHFGASQILILGRSPLSLKLNDSMPQDCLVCEVVQNPVSPSPIQRSCDSTIQEDAVLNNVAADELDYVLILTISSHHK